MATKPGPISENNFVNKLPPDIQSDFAKPDLESWEQLVQMQLKGKSLPKRLYNTLDQVIRIHPIYTSSHFDHLKPSAEKNSIPGQTAPKTIRTAVKIFGNSPQQQKKNLSLAAASDLIHLKPVSRSDNNSNIGKDRVYLPTVHDFRDYFGDINLSEKTVLLEAEESIVPLFAIQQLALKKVYMIHDPYAKALRSGKMGKTAFLHQSRQLMEDPDLLSTSFGLDGRLYRECGGNIIQELAFTLAAATDLIRDFIKDGIDIEAVLPRIFFNFSTGPDFFKEIVKLRAFRKLWARLVESFTGTYETENIEIISHSARFNKTSLDHHVNILRTISETLAATYGGSDMMITEPFDCLDASNQALAYRLALNIPLVLTSEGLADRVIDPGSGSWFIEDLTVEFCEKSWRLFQKIEQKGGMTEAIEEGFIQSLIKREKALQIENMNNNSLKMVGVNIYQDHNQKSPDSADKKISLSASEKPAPSENLFDPGLSLEEVISQLKGYIKTNTPLYSCEKSLSTYLDSHYSTTAVEIITPFRRAENSENINK